MDGLDHSIPSSDTDNLDMVCVDKDEILPVYWNTWIHNVRVGCRRNMYTANVWDICECVGSGGHQPSPFLHRSLLLQISRLCSILKFGIFMPHPHTECQENVLDG